MMKDYKVETFWHVYADTVNEVDSQSRFLLIYIADNEKEANSYIESIAPLEGFVGVPLIKRKVYICVEKNNPNIQ